MRPSYNYYDFLSHQYPRERMSGKNWTEFRNQPKALLEYIIQYKNWELESGRLLTTSRAALNVIRLSKYTVPSKSVQYRFKYWELCRYIISDYMISFNSWAVDSFLAISWFPYPFHHVKVVNSTFCSKWLSFQFPHMCNNIKNLFIAN